MPQLAHEGASPVVPAFRLDETGSGREGFDRGESTGGRADSDSTATVRGLRYSDETNLPPSHRAR